MGGRSKRNLALYLQEEDLMRPRYENTGTLGGHSSTEATGGARLRQAPAAVLIRLESLQTHRLVLTGPDEMKLSHLNPCAPADTRSDISIVAVLDVVNDSTSSTSSLLGSAPGRPFVRRRGVEDWLTDRLRGVQMDGRYLAIMVRCLRLHVPPTTQRSCTRRKDGCAAYARVSCA